MHPQLHNFSLMTWGEILATEESARDFLLHPAINLVPDRDQTPDCPQCGSQMKAISNKNKKFGFIFVCSQKYKTKCNGKVCPTQGTFMEGAKIGCQDILAIIFAFVLRMGIVFTHRQINQWRSKRNLKSMSSETIVDYFCYLREIAEVVASHNSKKLGGFGNYYY
ncbi:hypothetical protein JTE90_029150 [Oedothorax gibbosus]|uniref:Transposase n=1 Tax=Oedothorax gibbosus TaxID=931172 RepID=A0AAV6U9U3_9ARAC|nr:hypothetical protein JTE90_029150 [Oedothorax gibbosus]